jgi:hypothetical protein
MEAKGPITFYDSVTGKPLFVAPVNRSPEEFLQVSFFVSSILAPTYVVCDSNDVSHYFTAPCSIIPFCLTGKQDSWLAFI